MKSILAEAEWWFLERLDYKGALLLVEVAEGIVSSIPESVSIDDAGTIDGARPIEVTDQSRRVRVEFTNVLAYQVTDESYAVSASGKTEGIGDQILCRHTSSEYFEHVRKNSLIKHLVDDPVHHYRLNLADDIIDVITISEPRLEML